MAIPMSRERDERLIWPLRISPFYVRCSLVREQRFKNRGCTQKPALIRIMLENNTEQTTSLKTVKKQFMAINLVQFSQESDNKPKFTFT